MADNSLNGLRKLWKELSSRDRRRFFDELQKEFNGGTGNIYKRGKTYYVRFRANRQEVRKAAGPTLKMAKNLLAKLRNEALENGHGIGGPSKMKLSTWVDKHYLPWARERKRSAWRDEISLKHLMPTFGHLRLTDINKSQVNKYMTDRLEKVSGPTVNREIACLKRVISLAVDAGELKHSPLARLKLLAESPARQPKLEMEDEVKLLQDSSVWLRPAIRLALVTGCRQGELLALRWKHINFEKGLVIIEDSKSGDSRRVPLHPALLEELRKRRGTPAGFVVKNSKGGELSRHSIHKAFQRATKKAGLEDLRFHDLRHVAASRMLEQGAPLPVVQSFLGHKTLAMSSRYTHTNWKTLSGFVSGLPVANMEVKDEQEDAG